jgi:hypothetical protein
MEVTEEAELMDFDSMEGGGFVAVCPMHHFTLFHLLSGLDKDVYYVVDANYSKSSNSSQPSLVMAIKEKFPDIDPASFFVAAFKRASYKKMFSKGKHESFLLTSILQHTPWFINQSQSNVEPTKSPDDQIAAFQKGHSSFCQYDFKPSESATPYVFKKAPDNAFLESLQAKHECGSDPVYMTVETSRKKKKANVRWFLVLLE